MTSAYLLMSIALGKLNCHEMLFSEIPGAIKNGTVDYGLIIHVDAAAQAALLALSKGTPGIYNIAEDDGAISSEKAKRDLGFDAGFRV